MPYLRQEDRKKLDGAICELAKVLPLLGEGWGAHLNYCIHRLVGMEGPKCYADWQEVIGALECAKQELYRVSIASYEDFKRRENGDVF